MNPLNWLKIEKIKQIHIRSEIYCQQFMLENRSVKNVFIENGEINKTISVNNLKKSFSDVFNFPISTIEEIIKQN
jgi:hypothetical protein